MPLNSALGSLIKNTEESNRGRHPSLPLASTYTCLGVHTHTSTCTRVYPHTGWICAFLEPLLFFHVLYTYLYVSV